MNNKSNGILPIDDNTLQLPRKKHPTPSIDEDLVERAALKTKQSSGQSGLDADGWRRVLAFNSYGTVNSDFRKVFAEFIKRFALKRCK